MAPALYPKWKQCNWQEAQTNRSLDQGDVNNGVYCALVMIGGSNYVYSTAHQFYSDIGGANILGTPQQITSPTVTIAANPAGGFQGGLFDGNDCTYVPVTGGTIGALILYRRNAGANTTWRLVFYYDTTGFGLPATPAGGNIIVSWSPNGIFVL
jgi:hypothetical protein